MNQGVVDRWMGSPRAREELARRKQLVKVCLCGWGAVTW